MASRRRTNGEGTIYRRRDGRFEAAVVLDGKRQRLVFRSHRDAHAWLIETIRTHQQGLPLPARRLSVAAFLREWHVGRRNEIRYSTWLREGQYLERHLLPSLGKLRLSRLEPLDVKRMQEQMLTAGASPTSVHHCHGVLHRALRDAVSWNLVPRNVAALVAPPRMATTEMKTLNATQAQALLAAAEGDRLEALWQLAVTTGMRSGELLGLRWPDLDLGRGVLHVRSGLVRSADGLVLAEPKTPHSRRTIALGGRDVAALERHRMSQAKERLRAGPIWQELDLVFPDECGRPISQERLQRKELWRLLEDAGLPRMRVHDLRHTAATLMLQAEVNPKVVSERLGHANIAFTLRVYAHVLPDMQRQAAQAIETLLLAGT